MLSRRNFIRATAATVGLSKLNRCSWSAGQPEASASPAPIRIPNPGEDVFGYVNRTAGQFDRTVYCRVLGAANEFKEGDEIVGVSAADAASRDHVRQLLARTTLKRLDAVPLLNDELTRFINQVVVPVPRCTASTWTLGQLKTFLLESNESAIKAIMPELSSTVVGCVVKLMSNDELIAIGQKVFNPLPGSSIGAKGYLGARVQPNSPTDNVDDIRWQVFDAWSYAVGDVLLGTNPVSSDPKSVAAVELTLRDLLTTFGIEKLMPHCVLSHIDVQAQVEEQSPGSTALWFQSIAGTDDANGTFDISIEKMRRYASQRTGQFGFYFETGQGADFTNGHAHGFDMVLHEARKYGMARALTHDVARAQKSAGSPFQPWVHLNDVAGFIGPEVFRSKEQLVRCCLEDIVMGKLHGLCLGLDVCSTLHMDVSLEDLDWCLDEIMPASPAYLMALPTKIDPMLGYLTTGYQDHVRLRKKFGYQVNDAMWKFFQTIGVIDHRGQPGNNFGRPLQVYLEYQKRRGDSRDDQAIIADGQRQLSEVRGRGVFVAEGHGPEPFDLKPELKAAIDRIYIDAKESIWAELSQEFINQIPDNVPVTTKSEDRQHYILHPESGEQLSETATAVIERLRKQHAGQVDVQIVISDGLNALSIMQEGHLKPFLSQLRTELTTVGLRPAIDNIVVESGRVRLGYRIGELLFGELSHSGIILHLIGERPGTGHRTFSTYITVLPGEAWAKPGTVDHNVTKVVSGIATTALNPVTGASEVVRIVQRMVI